MALKDNKIDVKGKVDKYNQRMTDEKEAKASVKELKEKAKSK